MKQTRRGSKRYLALLLSFVLVMSNANVAAYAKTAASVPNNKVGIAQKGAPSGLEEGVSDDSESTAFDQSKTVNGVTVSAVCSGFGLLGKGWRGAKT